MVVIKFLESVVKALEELVYLVAIILFQLWQYRVIILTLAVMGSLSLASFITYEHLTN